MISSKTLHGIQVAFQLGNFLLNGGDALRACMKTLRCHLDDARCEAVDGRKHIHNIPTPTPLWVIFHSLTRPTYSLLCVVDSYYVSAPTWQQGAGYYVKLARQWCSTATFKHWVAIVLLPEGSETTIIRNRCASCCGMSSANGVVTDLETRASRVWTFSRWCLRKIHGMIEPLSGLHDW